MRATARWRRLGRAAVGLVAAAALGCGGAADDAESAPADVGSGPAARAAAARTGRVAVENAELGWVVEGAGRPCLVIGSATYYRRTFSAAFGERLRCAYLDTRTFTAGAAAPAGGYDLDAVIADVERGREAVGFDSAVVIGHSMHGVMALEYARRHPDRATHVVMLGMAPASFAALGAAAGEFFEADASPERKRVHAARQGRWAEPDAAGLTGPERFVETYVTNGALYWHDPAFDAAPLWEGVDVNVERFEELVAASMMAYNVAAGGPIETPVLAVVGRYDYVVPYTLWDDAAKAPFRDLTLEVFEASGHTPQLEEPDRFDRVLFAWLERADG